MPYNAASTKSRVHAVNPQAVNEPGFDVFTQNKRSVLYMTDARSNKPIAYVAIGAMLVSIPLGSSSSNSKRLFTCFMT